MTLSGDSLIGILSKNKLPDQIVKMIRQEIISKKLPEELFNFNIPLSLDENQLSKFLKEQSASQFTNSAESIRQNGKELKEIPSMLQDLSDLILIFDFLSGISKFARGSYPAADDNFVMRNSANLFLDNPQPVDFELSSPFRCSILTGANSGGKTTLLEHIIQNIALFNIGLPVRGELKTPVFSEVYYFAKNKGSMSKGAFETLLTQMAGIKPGKKTLILADEMEAVTEPGVAADIVCATAKYFISKECFLVIATHLGKEIQKNLPLGARIDGIEAKGLDENNELIVDHNPVLGRLANSTPELIVERLAKKNKEAYFQFLFEEISS
jgi:dsDNA-specific endonuclease/ATPase MutS2